ncbi:MAG: neutral/alkaline non-lysosomal ceramidase N-terminal domain-containing protein [Propionicimonas sp.]|uniref:neutral/alkaline non-lysosomal ceramidase N-terminal domain-containing protein n=1 Tax=Propionicimonas sp. TaxID=1955623 RepID=UPI003D12FFF9
MKVGSARFDMTPSGEFHLGGYRAESRLAPAAEVHDHIFGNALLFEQDGERAFLLSLDLVEVELSMAEEVKTLLAGQFGIDRDLVLIAATHDHSSIAEYHRAWWTRCFDPAYYDQLIGWIVDSYVTCLAELQDVTARYGRETVLGYYGNRNHPGEPADNEVIVVEFVDADSTPVAGIVNWAVHSTVLPADNDQLTGDLAGAVAAKLAEPFGFHPLVLNGAGGDSSNRHQRQGQDFAELERVSSGLAERIASIRLDRSVELGPIRCQTLFHTVHNDDFHLDALGWVVDLGELRLFVFPGELGSAFGPQLKQTHPELALVAGYTNGYYAYWMPASEYGLSFETTTSRVPKGEPERLVAKFIQTASRLDE